MNKTNQKLKVHHQVLFYIVIFSFVYICIIFTILIYNIKFIPMNIFNILAQIGAYVPLLGSISGILWIVLMRNEKIRSFKKIVVISITTILSFSFIMVFYMASSIWR